MISPWLFFIGWILKSWYVGSSQIDILRLFYRMHNYRLSLSFCAGVGPISDAFSDLTGTAINLINDVLHSSEKEGL